MTTRVSPGHPIRVISRLRSPNHREYAYCSQRSRAARLHQSTRIAPSVEYVLGTTNFVRRDADQNVLLDTRAADAEPHTSDFLWSDPFPPHSLENVGDAELRVIKHAILADREATTGIEPVWTALQRVEFRAYELFAGSLSSARCSEFCSVP